jgi:glutamine amidotransferase
MSNASPKVCVVDYGIGNVFSVCNAVEKAGADVTLTRDPKTLLAADRLILPGVGAFKRAMEALTDLGLADVLSRYRETERPFLGICIGMQVMMDLSEEFGSHKGLGYVPGRAQRIDTGADQDMRVPHIAWASLDAPAGQDAGALWADTPLRVFTPGQESVYFVHSFHCQPDNREDIIAVAHYEGQSLTAAVRHGNTFGVQFHPERSGKVGQTFIKSFVSA